MITTTSELSVIVYKQYSPGHQRVVCKSLNKVYLSKISLVPRFNNVLPVILKGQFLYLIEVCRYYTRVGSRTSQERGDHMVTIVH